MMPPYPFFGFPPFRRPMPYFSPYNNIHNSNLHSAKTNPKTYCPNDLQNVNKKVCDNCSNNLKSDNTFDEDIDYDKCFEIFGLKLYFDDLLILALLFFLYQEEVKDTYLYMALILLLIT